MKLRMSLQTRFMVWAIVLITVLLVSILLVIEQREVKAIFEEQKEKGVLIA
ncbi:MAG: HAMP domain-containing histidine kinase, partial [Candidatus Aminicenantes bacterium]|nr:HAMP domain-containing histidine kinase [Candidatus Aminicenantes bacterium]